jgi:hypothetical protein
MEEIHKGEANSNKKVFQGVYGKGQSIIGVAVFKVRVLIVAISVVSIHNRNEQ